MHPIRQEQKLTLHASEGEVDAASYGLSRSHHLVSGSQDCTWPRQGSRPAGSWGQSGMRCQLSASDLSPSEVAWAEPLSLAPGWLQRHKAQSARNRGVHTVTITSSTRQWCSALGLTSPTFTLSRLLSSWIYIKQCIWPKDDWLAIQKFQTLSKFYRIFNYHHGKFVGKSFLMFQTVWRHQTKKNANDYFLFIAKKKKKMKFLFFALRWVARAIILQRHPVWTSREQCKCRGEHVKSKV